MYLIDTRDLFLLMYMICGLGPKDRIYIVDRHDSHHPIVGQCKVCASCGAVKYVRLKKEEKNILIIGDVHTHAACG